MFDIIAAVDAKWGLSKDNKLPWVNTPEGRADMKWFKETTIGHAVVMGRKTWETLSAPLPDRVNIVLSRTLESPDAIIVRDFNDALKWCVDNNKQCFVIGGAEIYNIAIKHPRLHRILLNKFAANYGCDTFFPEPDNQNISRVILKYNEYYSLEYDFNNREECYYLCILAEISHADTRPNRTGVATRGSFHEVLKFSLSDERGRVLPLLTTKKVNWSAVYHELVWFLRGSTTTEYLTENGVKIWDGNSTREFLDSRGLTHYAPGKVGPIYGSQWRNWNECGTDQLVDVINKLQTDPGDRRMIVSAWNVDRLDEMALPPCHYSFQFHVDFEDNVPARLNCLVNMRSADLALGVPFNIASYAMLTHIVSQITSIPAGTLSISMCDCHVYENHLDGISKQLKRAPRRFPTIQFGPRATGATIDDYANNLTIDDFTIVGYDPHPYIHLQMAV